MESFLYDSPASTGPFCGIVSLCWLMSRTEQNAAVKCECIIEVGKKSNKLFLSATYSLGCKRQLTAGTPGCSQVVSTPRGTIGQAIHGDNPLQPVRFCKSVLFPRP